jgi:hypothetical protein
MIDGCCYDDCNDVSAVSLIDHVVVVRTPSDVVVRRKDPTTLA